MTQEVILDNFIHYLDIASKNNIEQLELLKKSLIEEQMKTLTKEDAIKKVDLQIDKLKQENEAFIQQFKKDLTIGYCFGLSLCDGAMDHIGKLHWWKHVLVELHNWDKTQKSLDTEITLPDSENSKPITRRKLFELALNYIIPSQASVKESYKKFMPTGISQRSILKPDARVIDAYNKQLERRQSYFEIIDKKGDIQTIKINKSIAGYFTADNLDLLISAQTIQGTICLLHSGNHAMRLKYDGINWILYDPNYPHNNIQSMHFTGDKHAVMKEIFARFKTHSISVEFAAFNPDKEFDFSAYDQLIRESPDTLLKEQGLHIIAKKTPEYLPEIIKLADNTEQGLKIRSALIKALQLKEPDSTWTGLHAISQEAPALIPELFKLADKTQSGIEMRLAIAAALAEKDDISTGLHFILQNSPNSLPVLFQLADNTPEGQQIRSAIAKGLADKFFNNCTGLHMVASFSPASLPGLFKLADGTPQGLQIQTAIAKALTEKSKDNETGLERIALFAPTSLPELFKLADSRPEGLQIRAAIATWLAEKRINDPSWLEFNNALLPELMQLADNTPQGLQIRSTLAKILPDLMQRADGTPVGLQIRSVIAKLVAAKDGNNRCGLYLIASDSLPSLFKLADNTPQGQEISSAIAEAISKKDNNNYSALDSIAVYAKGSIHLTIHSAIQLTDESTLYQALQKVLQTLAAINPDGLTGWQMIDKYASPSSQKEQIIDSILTAIRKLNTEDVIKIGIDISDALANNNSIYHGLCKERGVFRSEYGKTNLWQKLIETTQEILKNRNDFKSNDEDIKKLQNVSTSRWR